MKYGGKRRNVDKSFYSKRKRKTDISRNKHGPTDAFLRDQY